MLDIQKSLWYCVLLKGGSIMYELYDKDGKFICYRMTKRIKNDSGEYDVLTARSKKSEKECRKIMDDKIRDYYI